MSPKVFLIGGAPGAGKTTLGTALAARLGISSLTIDDLVTAVQSVTTPATHPGLHLMWQTSHLDYFTNTPVAKLKEDALRQHEVAWQFIEPVIRKHAGFGAPVVIDGWHLWPSKVAQLQLDNVWAGWLVASEAVLEEREREHADWLHGSPNPKQMFDNFLARSLWFNTWIREETARFSLPMLFQTGSKSVEELCELILGNGQD
ncbi:MAG: AAA family ATPase [Anaerolineae bacterium]|nr:AAA family ATPase [Anaerolineae bacterium]